MRRPHADRLGALVVASERVDGGHCAADARCAALFMPQTELADKTRAIAAVTMALATPLPQCYYDNLTPRVLIANRAVWRLAPAPQRQLSMNR